MDVTATAISLIRMQTQTSVSRRVLRDDDLRHLLRRLAFSATPAHERALVGTSPEAAVALLVEEARRAPRPAAPAVARPPWVNTALRPVGMAVAKADALREAQVEASLAANEQLRQWWLRELMTGPALRENLTLFFHGTLGSSSRTVDMPQALFGNNDLLRRGCLGTIPALLESLVLDPAMMMLIGMDEHGLIRISDRPAKLVLDNWTVGPGAYADRDVEELSRALTGWRLEAAPGEEPKVAIDPAAPRTARRTGLVPVFDPKEFDADPKTILGETSNFDARGAVRRLARHPATAQRFARLFVRYFGVDDPKAALEQQIASAHLATDGAVEAMLRALVGAPEFWSESSRWSLIKSPVHLAAGACRQLEIADPPVAIVSRWMTGAGQTLFDTPNSGEGPWPDQEAWVTPADRLAVRYQLPFVLAGRVPALGIVAPPKTPPEASAPVGGRLRQASSRDIVRRLDAAPGVETGRLDKSDLIARIMASPQYQLA